MGGPLPNPLPKGEGTRGPLPNPLPKGEGTGMDEARGVLKRVFGYDEFRPLQEEIIVNVLSLIHI